MKGRSYVLPVIVFAQFCCTSLWFAGNAVLNDLAAELMLTPQALGYLTAAVQFGFIAGTLFFAVLSLADRFSPSKVFFACAIAGAAFNAAMALQGNNFTSLIFLRFITGFTLAGIYPVGMKIAADYFDKGLGRSLGFLVGALVLGTGFPHLLRNFTGSAFLPWKAVLLTTTGLAIFGGLLMLLLVPDGPYKKKMHKVKFRVIKDIFKVVDFRKAALGYFGHMWELYAFWAFIPIFLLAFDNLHLNTRYNIPLLTFLIIGIGGIGCIVGGYISEKLGTKRTAAVALFLSGCCCLLSPLFFLQESIVVLTAFLLFWGFMVVADSPLFSTLVAQNSPPENRGTALTIVNCIGFSITIGSILLLNVLAGAGLPHHLLFLSLLPGPVVGLYGMYYRSAQS